MSTQQALSNLNLTARIIADKVNQETPLDGNPDASQIRLTQRFPAISTKPTPDSLAEQSGWKAEIQLGFSPARTMAAETPKTVVRHRRQSGPLAIQRPLYPEGSPCHVYLLHPPGGVVGGDQLRIQAQSDSGAHALVTTPGATKFYRSAGAYAYQRQELRVETGGILEWFPQENIYFPQAKVRLDTEITIAEGGRFVGWELHCFGRPALKEGFDSGNVVGCTRLTVNQRLVLAEQINVQGGDMHQQHAGLRGYAMMGSLFVVHADEKLLKVVQTLLNEHSDYLNKNNMVAAVTALSGDIRRSRSDDQSVLVVRAMGQSSESMTRLFTRIWLQVRTHWLGESPAIPRIWAT
ncbi:urease accessory protein UreD [Photobacterium ganghwense]|uniref:urease accessory protein UreD n=1 Tax=Photobacterium ganghwense TaxID=320778 RepID=UPI0039EF4241